MMRWIAVLVALTAVAVSVSISQLFDQGDEADEPLSTLRGDGFTVRMPGTPERSEQPIALPIVGPAKALVEPTKAIGYASESHDKAYMITVIVGPTTVAFDLTTGLDGMASAVGGSVRSRATTRHGAHRAIDGRIARLSDPEATMFVRIVHAGERVFVLQAIVRGDDVRTPPRYYAPFIKSLRIRKQPATVAAARKPIVARKLPARPPQSAAAGLRACRSHAAGRHVSEAVRERAQQICAAAAGGSVEDIQSATLAACLAVAQEDGQLERCGFEVIR